jgi:hypothetical protein
MAKKQQCRYIVNAVGKNGETYITSCDNKTELQQWIKQNEDKLNKKKLTIKDNYKQLTFIKIAIILASVSVFGATITYLSNL